ncbi:MAG TPA: PIN domain-containing protein [Balneolaceae bacterium]|nr:PIN domain-containing protein [Balneolaceae bacterium]
MCIDTAPFIYYMERHKTYGAIVKPIFKEIEKGNIQAITTNITLLEVLVQPYRFGDEKLAQRYRDILLNSEGLTTLTITHEITENAAKLRAKYLIRTPDAIQIATAVITNADAFLTNDEALKK